MGLVYEGEKYGISYGVGRGLPVASLRYEASQNWYNKNERPFPSIKTQGRLFLREKTLCSDFLDFRNLGGLV
jgi:hypothetical protein